jgi:uncharacterized damage-inducible protein DinB
MADLLASAATTIPMNTALIRKYTAGWDEPQWLFTINGRTSNACWLVGHTALTRERWLERIGGRFKLPDWAGAFANSTAPPDAMPAGPERMVDLADEVGQALVDRLPCLTDDQLDADCQRDLPNGGRTLADYLHFLLWHESYHVGQLAMLHIAQGGKGIGR